MLDVCTLSSYQHMLKHTKLVLLFLLLATPLLVIIFGSVPSSATKNWEDEPASQGRPITPAGVLIKDAATRQPAVGSLTVDFVRSPDSLGPDGAGRYVIAVNSGYGIQFTSSGNKAQQSLAVIDLKHPGGPTVVQNVYFPTPQSVNVGVDFGRKADEDGSYPMYVSGGFQNKILDLQVSAKQHKAHNTFVTWSEHFR